MHSYIFTSVGQTETPFGGHLEHHQNTPGKSTRDTAEFARAELEPSLSGTSRDICFWSLSRPDNRRQSPHIHIWICWKPVEAARENKRCIRWAAPNQKSPTMLSKQGFPKIEKTVLPSLCFSLPTQGKKSRTGSNSAVYPAPKVPGCCPPCRTRRSSPSLMQLGAAASFGFFGFESKWWLVGRPDSEPVSKFSSKELPERL